MSGLLLDTAIPRPFVRNSFLSSSQENVLDNGGRSQSSSRPNSRRSSRIFSANHIPSREDSIPTPQSTLQSTINSSSLNTSSPGSSWNFWADSPNAYDSPTTSIGSGVTAKAAARPSASRASDSFSIGNSWGVSSIGRGFDWTWNSPAMVDDADQNTILVAEPEQIEDLASDPEEGKDDTIGSLEGVQYGIQLKPKLWQSYGRSTFLSLDNVPGILTDLPKMTLSLSEGILIPDPTSATSTTTPVEQRILTRPTTPSSLHGSVPPSPRYRRRSSQKRFSLVSGRLSYTPPPSPPPDGSISASKAPKLLRLASTSSFMSVNSVMTGPPTPGKVHYAGDRSIAEFVIQGDVGQGAYGLVKRGREVMMDGSYGPELIIKEVIKSRILADCWKKHPVHGTIPIEIYVMLAVSSAAYALPPARPWDPYRHGSPPPPPDPKDSAFPIQVWKEGEIVRGHPNICPLIDFFEDKNFYYLILPSALPPPNSEPRPKDLFDLVEVHPQGLPPALVRSYLGQIADAMAFLHNRGIVHRDIKDENVVLSADGGHVWLIDFGSAGVVRKTGWNSFSGTLDYASPEILRGEFYTGKEQDVWAYGVVAYVLLVGECPFATATDAQTGLVDGSGAFEALTARCLRGHEREGVEEDEGGALEDAFALVRACLHTEIGARPTFEEVIQHRFLVGKGGWTGENVPRSPPSSEEEA